jgi:hypothetical protein
MLLITYVSSPYTIKKFIKKALRTYPDLQSSQFSSKCNIEFRELIGSGLTLVEVEYQKKPRVKKRLTQIQVQVMSIPD